MNLQDLWPGNDYAWYYQKGRGEIYRRNAKRVKIIQCYKRRLSGNERETGFAKVMMCEDDGTPIEDSDGTHKTREVRARDIAMRWEQYADERDHREAIREQQEKERLERIARIEEERQRQEQLEQENREKLRELLQNRYGLPADAIGTISNTHVYIHREVLERELANVK